jgi:hypothetical protein
MRYLTFHLAEYNAFVETRTEHLIIILYSFQIVLKLVYHSIYIPKTVDNLLVNLLVALGI